MDGRTEAKRIIEEQVLLKVTKELKRAMITYIVMELSIYIEREMEQLISVSF